MVVVPGAMLAVQPKPLLLSVARAPGVVVTVLLVAVIAGRQLAPHATPGNLPSR